METLLWKGLQIKVSHSQWPESYYGQIEKFYKKSKRNKWKHIQVKSLYLKEYGGNIWVDIKWNKTSWKNQCYLYPSLNGNNEYNLEISDDNYEIVQFLASRQ